MKYAVKSVVGRVRSSNQDYYHVPRPGAGPDNLFIVADGMGGRNAGEVASTLAVCTVCEYINSHLPKEDIALLLRSAVAEANKVIYTAGRSDKKYNDMGTTITAAYIYDDIIYLAQVGDSRAYLYNGQELRQLTVDHSYVQELVSLGLISSREAEHHPEKNMITRALGTERYINVDVYQVPWKNNELLLLCSDGLTNMLEGSDIVKILSRPGTCDEYVEALVSAAEEAGGRDNITAICVSREG